MAYKSLQNHKIKTVAKNRIFSENNFKKIPAKIFKSGKEFKLLKTNLGSYYGRENVGKKFVKKLKLTDLICA